MRNTQRYEDLLKKEKASLENDLSSIGRHNPSNEADWEAVPQETGIEPDTGDAADLIEGYEENTAILKELEIRYNKVLEALERIQKGTYGMCHTCKKTITKKRLDADPAADICIKHLNK